MSSLWQVPLSAASLDTLPRGYRVEVMVTCQLPSAFLNIGTLKRELYYPPMIDEVV